MKKIKLSIVIISFNTQKILANCLKSVYATLGNLSAEIIVVDNDSKDGSPEMVAKKFPKVILLSNKKNRGFGQANNQGVARSRGELVLLLNSDTIVHPQALLRMVRYLETHPQVGVVGCKLLNADGTDQPSAGRFPTLSVSALMLFGEHY
ncbi:glycosyltransferase family 2 protein, partial [Patescibacteria group bacterium]